MCGIFGILNDTNICEKVIKSFETGKARGPENIKIEKYVIQLLDFID